MTNDKFGLTDNDLSGIHIIRKAEQYPTTFKTGEKVKHPIEAVLDNYGTYLKAVSKWAEAGNVYAVPEPPPLTTSEQCVQEIIKTLKENSDVSTDSKCLDDVVAVLNYYGYTVFEKTDEKEFPYGDA